MRSRAMRHDSEGRTHRQKLTYISEMSAPRLSLLKARRMTSLGAVSSSL